MARHSDKGAEGYTKKKKQGSDDGAPDAADSLSFGIFSISFSFPKCASRSIYPAIKNGLTNKPVVREPEQVPTLFSCSFFFLSQFETSVVFADSLFFVGLSYCFVTKTKHPLGEAKIVTSYSDIGASAFWHCFTER